MSHSLYSRFFYLAALATAVLSLPASGQAQTLKRGPYLQNATSSTMMVDWVTAATGTSTVRYGTTTAYGQETAPATPTQIAVGFKHAVTVSGLSPNTKYYYQVVTNGTTLSPAGDADYFFKTPPAVGSSTPFTFAVIGDMGTPGEGQVAIADLIDVKNPDFVIAVGDIVYDYSTSNADSMYFSVYAKSMHNTVYYPTCGNHDTGSGSECAALINDNSLPQGGHAAGATYDSSYSFDYGNMHFATYNSTPTDGGAGSYNPTTPASSTPEFKWLYNDLKGSSQPWKTGYWHHNGWSAGTHAGSFPAIINNPIKVAQDTGTNLVYWGHSHVFERFGRYPATTGPVFHTVGNSGQGGRAKSCGAFSGGPSCLESNNPTASALYGMEFVEVNGNTATERYIGRSTTTATGPIIEGTPVSYTTSGGVPPTPDTTPPTISLQAITSPINGTKVITADASDNSGSLNRVEFYIDGVLKGTDTIAAPYSYSWVTTPADNGQHTLTAKAYDNASPANSATSAALTVTVNTVAGGDTVAPVISAVTAGSISTTGATITWTTDESSSTVVEYGTSTTYNGTKSGTGSVTNHSASLTGLAPATLYHYRVISADSTGNTASSTDKTFTTLTATGPGDPPTTVTGVSAYWRLDDGSGQTAADSSVNGNNGALMNGPAWVAGKIGQALDFDGVDDVVTYTSKSQSLVSISAWVSSDSIGESTFPRIIETPGWRLFYARSTGASQNTVGFRSAFSDAGGEWRTAPNSIQDNTAQNPWTHIVVTYDSSSASNNPVIYINGAATTVIRTTAPAGTQGSNAGTGYIGNSPANDRTWDGRLDEVRIYESILSAAEVQSLYSGGATGPSTSPSNFRLSIGAATPGGPADTVLPTASITLPAAGITISGNYAVTASASDNVAVTAVELFVDNISKASDGTAPYSMPLNTAALANGWHTLTVKARDAAGNIGTSATVSVIVSNTATDKLPAEVLDLKNWKITYPIDSSGGVSGAPLEIKQPQLATEERDPYFLALANGTGVQFRAASNGAHTSGSANPRSELREMVTTYNAGQFVSSDNASWSTSSGRHEMWIDQAVTAVPTGKPHVVVGQVHDANDDVIVIRLEFPKLYVNVNGSNAFVLDENYTLGKRFNIKFVAQGGKIMVYYNSAAAPAYTLTINTSGCYFKAGAYTQANCSNVTCSASNYGEAVLYGLTLSHEN